MRLTIVHSELHFCTILRENIFIPLNNLYAKQLQLLCSMVIWLIVI